MTTRDVLLILIVILIAAHFIHGSLYITGPVGLILLLLLVIVLAGKL